MPQTEERARVLQEWLLLPASRRRHPTDVVAFAYRLLQDRPDLIASSTSHEHVVSWLLPHLVETTGSDGRPLKRPATPG